MRPSRKVLSRRQPSLEAAVDQAGAAKRYGQPPWRARSRQDHGVIKVGLPVAFEAHEVRIQRDGVLALARLAHEAVRPGCPQHLLGLLGNGLGQACCRPEAVADAVDGRQIGKGGAEIPALPEQVGGVLCHVAAAAQERPERSGLARVKVVQVDAAGARISGVADFLRRLIMT